MPRRSAPVALGAAIAAVGLCLSSAPAAQAAPVADPYVDPGSGALTLSPLSSVETGQFDESAAEIVVHDPGTQQLFVVNAAAGLVDVVDVSDAEAPAEVGVLDATGIEAADGSTVPAGTVVNSVDVRADGVVAVALEMPEKTDPGYVAFFTTARQRITAVRVGSLPDMLTFTPDEQTVVVAVEAEPSDDFTIDPEGVVEVVDVSGQVAELTQDDVRTADFRAYDEGTPLPAGVRVFGPDVANPPGPGRVARNLEPEYVVVDPTSSTAHVSLQEANVFAVVDLATAEVTDLLPLGTKDHTLPGNELDASDRDPEDAPAVTIRDWPLNGMYLPDAIATYQSGGEQYLVTANEGDAREFGEYVEPARVKDLTLCADADFGGYVGPGQEFADAAELQADENLGRLEVTTESGRRQGQDCYEELFSYGARSFSIFTADGELVFDSGSDFEDITAALEPDFFNSDNSEATLESRSDAKGPEPEAVAVSTLGSRTYAFIGFERVGGGGRCLRRHRPAGHPVHDVRQQPGLRRLRG